MAADPRAQARHHSGDGLRLRGPSRGLRHRDRASRCRHGPYERRWLEETAAIVHFFRLSDAEVHGMPLERREGYLRYRQDYLKAQKDAANKAPRSRAAKGRAVRRR